MISIKYLWLGPLLLGLMLSSYVISEPVSTGFLNHTAIGGRDTVSYFEGQVEKGIKTWIVEWKGAKWRFASQSSADKFKANPDVYAPRFNGFCSNALSLGEGLIRTDGSVWEFFGGELHLFYAERGRQRWLNGDWKEYKKEASAAWHKLKQE